MEKKNVKSRRKYTKEFKLEAVRLAQEGGGSVAEAARRLGIDPEYLYRWQRELKDSEAFRGNGQRTAEQERIRELESENRRLRMERDFLKKTAAYFAKDES
jgi:transposase